MKSVQVGAQAPMDDPVERAHTEPKAANHVPSMVTDAGFLARRLS